MHNPRLQEQISEQFRSDAIVTDMKKAITKENKAITKENLMGYTVKSVKKVKIKSSLEDFLKDQLS